MSLRLPLTSFERYQLSDDTDANPNVIVCTLRVSGHVDRDAATIALREAASRHPLSYAIVERGRWRRQYWVAEESRRNSLNWEFDETGSQPRVRRIDVMQKQTPARFVLSEQGDTTLLSFQTHHAAVDGLGGLQYVVDWLLTYHRITTGQNRPRSRETDLSLLQRRNHLRLLQREFLAKLWIQPIAMLGATKFLFRRVQCVTPAQPDDGKTAPLLTATLDQAQLESVRNEAADCRATANEILLKAAFMGIHDYRKSAGLHRDNEWLRLVVPMSIRDYADRRLPACNRVTIVQLDRRDRDFADPPGLVWGLNYELENIRSWNLEKTFLLALRWVSWIPGLVKRMAGKRVCRATSVMTNLGAPLERVKLERIEGKLRSGNLLIEDVELLVPLRPLTPIGFALVRYAGRQKINMHYDPAQIQRQQAQEILDCVVARL